MICVSISQKKQKRWSCVYRHQPRFHLVHCAKGHIERGQGYVRAGADQLANAYLHVLTASGQ